VPWLSTVARFALGVVWLVAGLLKVGDPAAAERAVRAYDLLPEALVPAVAHGQPFLEIALGLLLIAGVAVRELAAVSVVLLVLFMAAVASAWARGLQIDCGCFGGGGEVNGDQTWAYVTELLRDAALLAGSIWLFLRPRTRWELFREENPS
jgi:uncharacterized membrane protein YphA (DoxX/SURF4 family)